MTAKPPKRPPWELVVLILLLLVPVGLYLGTRSAPKPVSTSVSLQETKCLKGHTDWVTTVDFSPDGHFLASCSYDSTVRLWDVTSGAERRRIKGQGMLYAVAFSPDGQMVAGGNYWGEITIWNANSGRVIEKLVGHSEAIWRVAFSPDGRFLASNSVDGTARIWNLRSGKEVFSLQVSKIGQLSLSQDGRLMATVLPSNSNPWMQAGDISLRDLPTGREITRVRKGKESIQTVAFSPDGRYLAASGVLMKSGWLYQVSRLIRYRMKAPRQLTAPIFDATVTLWEVPSGRRVWGVRSGADAFYSLDFSPDGRLLAGTTNRHWPGSSGITSASVVILDSASGQEVLRLERGRERILPLAFSPDGTMLATGSSDGMVRLWTVRR